MTVAIDTLRSTRDVRYVLYAALAESSEDRSEAAFARRLMHVLSPNDAARPTVAWRQLARRLLEQRDVWLSAEEKSLVEQIVAQSIGPVGTEIAALTRLALALRLDTS